MQKRYRSSDPRDLQSTCRTKEIGLFVGTYGETDELFMASAAWRGRRPGQLPE